MSTPSSSESAEVFSGFSLTIAFIAAALPFIVNQLLSRFYAFSTFAGLHDLIHVLLQIVTILPFCNFKQVVNMKEKSINFDVLTPAKVLAIMVYIQKCSLFFYSLVKMTFVYGLMSSSWLAGTGCQVGAISSVSSLNVAPTEAGSSTAFASTKSSATSSVLSGGRIVSAPSRGILIIQFLIGWSAMIPIIFMKETESVIMPEIKSEGFWSYHFIGIGLFTMGFLIEFISDWQKFYWKCFREGGTLKEINSEDYDSESKTNTETKSKKESSADSTASEVTTDSKAAANANKVFIFDLFPNIGFWKHSRHPNYFGEMLMVCAVSLYITPIGIRCAIDIIGRLNHELAMGHNVDIVKIVFSNLLMIAQLGICLVVNPIITYYSITNIAILRGERKNWERIILLGEMIKKVQGVDKSTDSSKQISRQLEFYRKSYREVTPIFGLGPISVSNLGSTSDSKDDIYDFNQFLIWHKVLSAEDEVRKEEIRKKAEIDFQKYNSLPNRKKNDDDDMESKLKESIETDDLISDYFKNAGPLFKNQSLPGDMGIEGDIKKGLGLSSEKSSDNTTNTTTSTTTKPIPTKQDFDSSSKGKSDYYAALLKELGLTPEQAMANPKLVSQAVEKAVKSIMKTKKDQTEGEKKSLRALSSLLVNKEQLKNVMKDHAVTEICGSEGGEDGGVRLRGKKEGA